MRKTSDPVDRPQRAFFNGGSELKAPASSLYESRFRSNLDNDYLTTGRLFCKRRMIGKRTAFPIKIVCDLFRNNKWAVQNRVVLAFLV